MRDKKFNRLLGELEAEIMDVVWGLEDATVREVLNKVKKKRKIAYTTVMTIMTRLCEKEFLKRKLNGQGAYLYNYVQSKDDFLVFASQNAIDNLLTEFGEIAVAQFISTVESSDAKNLKEFRNKLKKIK